MILTYDILISDIDRLNNTKWKGSLIKVQVAKESFIDKLKREQLENRKNGWNQAPIQKEVVENDNSEKGRNKRHANDVLNQLNKFTDRKNKFNKFQDQNINDHHQKKANGNCGFEIVSSQSTKSTSPPKATSSSSSPQAKQKKQKKRSKKDETSSSEDDSDDDVRDGIPKFKGLLMCYPDGIPDVKTPDLPEETDEETVIQPEEKDKPTVISAMRQKLLALAFEEEARKKSPIKLQKSTPASPQNKPASTINFRKSKQQKSDILRLQSMEKMKELKAQQNNLIKTSLSSVAASAPITEQRKLLESDDEDGDRGTGEDGKGPKTKKSKMTLFDDDDEDEEDNMEKGKNGGDAFKVRKQFEGASGQKLLELQTRFANDDRFKIDDRFKESDGEEDEVEAVEQEKEKQFDILTGILGKVVTSTKPPSGQKKGGATNKESFSSVIMPRYDPEDDSNENNEKMEVEEEKSSSKKAKDKTSKTESEGSKEKVIRSTEPATFKTVSNLKALFSSTEGSNEKDKGNAPETSLFSKPATIVATQPQSSFSLLATFGKNEEDEIKADTKTRTKSSESAAEGPRTFWQSNPFRYDSSDDEGDDAKKVKVTIKPQDKPAAVAPLIIHGKSPFFFTKNDDRFKDVEDFFLKKEETVSTGGGGEGVEGRKDEAEVKKNLVEEYALKRQELKSIVKAKIRNSRRKDEKRTLAIKRAIRKKKRKVYQKSKKF